MLMVKAFGCVFGCDIEKYSKLFSIAFFCLSNTRPEELVFFDISNIIPDSMGFMPEFHRVIDSATTLV